MPDPFDPSAAAPVFDPQTLMQAAPGTQPPPPQTQGFDKQKLLRLIPLVAAAVKGGPGALEGLLQGYQQAEAQRQQQGTQQAQTQRQSMLDDRALQQTQFTQRYQVAQLQQQQEKARADLVQEFSKALTSEELTDPEAVRALTQLYEARGQALGVRPGTFETTAMQVVKPSALETKAARKKVNELRTQFSTKWMEEGAKFTHELPGGKRVSFQQLLAMAGMTPGPTAPQTAPNAIASDIPLDRQHAMALVSGNEALAKQIETALSRQDATRRDPPRESNSGVMDARRFSMEQRLVAQWDKAQAPVRDMRRALVLMETGLRRFRSGDKNGGSQNILVTFQKILDPTSVVRESEYARSAHGVSMLSRIDGYVQRLQAGGAGVPERDLAAMVQTAREMFSGLEDFNRGLRGRIERTAGEYELDPRLIFEDVGPADGGGAVPSRRPTPQRPR